jgi:hypothetical protein
MSTDFSAAARVRVQGPTAKPSRIANRIREIRGLFIGIRNRYHAKVGVPDGI